MRQWNVDPRVLCTQHLLGEHYECHMFVGAINRGTSMRGFIDNGMLEPATLHLRHDQLVAEMRHRGMKHKTPLKAMTCEWVGGNIDVEQNLRVLAERCPVCRTLQELSRRAPL